MEMFSRGVNNCLKVPFSHYRTRIHIGKKYALSGLHKFIGMPF